MGLTKMQVIDETVMVHGYKAIVKAEYMPGVYEVWLDSGVVVVPESEIKPACSWCKSKAIKIDGLCASCYKLTS